MFKDSFKYYKAKWPVPDFKEVEGFESEPSKAAHALELNVDVMMAAPLGCRPVHTWRCYTLSRHPGLIVVRNPFTPHGQRYWLARCLRDLPCRPNIVNLNERLFSPPVLEDWWRELQSCTDKNEARRMKISMRWCTLGYHHDWDTKVYSEAMRNTFPSDLGKMCDFFATALGFEGFVAEAAIVNYYPVGTTLAGHTDHSEVNLDAPLFSFSFGQTAIFLIGGKTKDEKPTAIFLQSGDVLVMSRESRLCYHAVPRVMKARLEEWNDHIEREEDSSTVPPNPKKLKTEYTSMPSEWDMDTLLYQQVADEVFWSPFKNYLNDSRININVRQVLNEGATSLQ